MLPKHIAEALVDGRKIEPIVRDNDHPVTVFFSDIVGAPACVTESRMLLLLSPRCS